MSCAVFSLSGAKKKWNRASGVWARKQISVDRVGSQQNRDGIVASEVSFCQGFGVGRKSLELQLNFLLAGCGDRPPEACSVFGFVGAEIVEMMYKRHWINDGTVGIGEKNHPFAKQEIKVAPWDGGGVGQRRDLVRCDGYENEFPRKFSRAVVK